MLHSRYFSHTHIHKYFWPLNFKAKIKKKQRCKDAQEEMIMHLEIESTVIAAANPEGQVPFIR